jgi:hypothetical protein
VLENVQAVPPYAHRHHFLVSLLFSTWHHHQVRGMRVRCRVKVGVELHTVAGI